MVESKSIISLLVSYLLHLFFILLFLSFFSFFLLNLLYFLQLFLTYSSLSCYFAGQVGAYIAYFEFFSIFLQVTFCYFTRSIRALQPHPSPCRHSASVPMSHFLLKSHDKPYIILVLIFTWNDQFCFRDSLCLHVYRFWGTSSLHVD